MLFFSTTAHKRSSQQWSYKQNFLLLRYSAHLSLDVHCSSHLKKKNIFLLTSLSPHIKKTISYPLSLSGCFFFLLSFSKIFFSQAHRHRTAPSSLSSPANLHRRSVPPTSSPTRPKLPHRRSVHLAGQLPLLSSLSQRLRRPQRHRPKPPPASTSPTQVFSHLSFSPICD